jgi:hypothetical protein
MLAGVACTYATRDWRRLEICLPCYFFTGLRSAIQRFIHSPLISRGVVGLLATLQDQGKVLRNRLPWYRERIEGTSTERDIMQR